MKSIISAIVVCAVALLTQATNFQVMVGSGGLVYSPNTVEAVAGDTVEFIVIGTHSIAEAAFDSPCQPLSGGAWSGISPKPSFVITVSNISSRFFYCTVDEHCQSGMVFALNPSGEMSFSAFQSAAEEATSSSAPPGNGPVGGTFGASSSSAGTVTTSAPAASSGSSTETSTESETQIYSTTASGASAAASTAAATSGGSKSSSGAAAAATSTSSSPATVVASSAFKQLGSVVGFVLFAAWYFM